MSFFFQNYVEKLKINLLHSRLLCGRAILLLLHTFYLQSDMANEHPGVSDQEMTEQDPTAETRKKDHIEMAFRSRVEASDLDARFYYEPMLAAHPVAGSLPAVSFLGKTLRTPVWVSSMTGGTAMAAHINRNLARACAEFGMGMGLGSCRQLLYSDEFLADFDVREEMGPDLPLLANLGVAQVEKLLRQKEIDRIPALLERLRADGLFIHVNPLQEAMQPEGDRFERPPLEVVQEVLETLQCPVVVKEVGQGFGPESLRALLQLPLAGIEFAAAGGTNFAKLELLRSTPEKQAIFEKIASLGHTAAQMLQWANALQPTLSRSDLPLLILSGGVRDFLDGYYLLQKSTFPAVYGQASGFLKHAQGDYTDLQAYVQAQVQGLELAYAFLRTR
ncbi:MAG: isopentenyl-diphosphate delta-isomerase [Bacteroidetes bacterium]|nr:isopentenyl-diphosphate delta-isomerase [Bacteroidota bacterium]